MSWSTTSTWSLKLIFGGLVVLMSTSFGRNMSFRLQVEVIELDIMFKIMFFRGLGRKWIRSLKSKLRDFESKFRVSSRNFKFRLEISSFESKFQVLSRNFKFRLEI